MSVEVGNTSRVFFREAICRAVGETLDAEPNAILMGQDVGAFGGSYKEFYGLFERFGPARVRDTPVAESAMVGLGVGAAAAGVRTLVSITYMDFVLLALDPLVNYAAKARFKTGGQIRVPMVVKVTAGAKGQGVAHSQSLESWLMSVPGLQVVAPSNVADAYGLMRSALQADGPVVYVDHKRLFPTSGLLSTLPHEVPFGLAVVSRPGRNATIVTHSYMVSVALAACEQLAVDGIDCEVIDLRSLAPLDLDTICTSVSKTGVLVTLEEGQVVCGVGAEIACRVQARLGPVKVSRLGAVPAPVSSNPVLEAASLPDAARVADAVRHLTTEGK
ncbi:MAG TPA: transketolase C-terminal domain-containing protein [Steroidobacteraceae bacterium]|jgi:pyruvate/2-oxoglutarate/acetoin dehydrogenase E1 component